MKRVLLAGMLCMSALSASALELNGVKLEERTELAGQSLVLNGAGLRSILFIKMYVAALYLDEKASSTAAIFSGRGVKRLALHVVADEIDSEHFLKGFRSGIEKNIGEQDAATMRERVQSFEHFFDAIKLVKKGDAITFDWQPGGILQVALNGNRLGVVAGEDFCRALFSIWLGDKPANAGLKKGLLGG